MKVKLRGVCTDSCAPAWELRNGVGSAAAVMGEGVGVVVSRGWLVMLFGKSGRNKREQREGREGRCSEREIPQPSQQ